MILPKQYESQQIVLKSLEMELRRFQGRWNAANIQSCSSSLYGDIKFVKVRMKLE